MLSEATIIKKQVKYISRMLNNKRQPSKLPVAVEVPLRRQTTQTTFTIMEKYNFADEWILDFHTRQISYYLLKPIGGWPLKRDSTVLELIVYRSSIVTFILMMFYELAVWIIYLMTNKLSFEVLIRNICPMLFVWTVILRFILLVCYRKKVRSCIDHIEKDWRDASSARDREIMLENAKLERLFGTMSVVLMFASGMLYLIVPMSVPPIVNENNDTIKPLPLPSEPIIVDVQVSPFYEITIVLQFVTSYGSYSTFCGTCCLTLKFIGHACGQCRIITYLFEELIGSSGQIQNSDFNKRISISVSRHIRVYRFISDIEEVLNLICLLEFLTASCNICFLSYFVLMDWNNEASMFQLFTLMITFISISFNIYIFCYLGERLIDYYKKIGDTCFRIEWYRLPHDKARSLIFPIIMSNYSIELTAGKIITIKMNSFLNILKTSMAYFNLLREVTMRNV